MAGYKPGPICSSEVGPNWIDDGTMCLSRSEPPVLSGLMGSVMSLVMGATPQHDKVCIPLKQVLMIDNEKFEVVVTSRFPMRIHPVTGKPQFHGATDLIAKPKGSDGVGQYAVPIQPWASGTVTRTGSQPGGAGNFVVIDHGNGIQTWYMHMETSSSIRPDTLITSPQIHPNASNPFVKVGQQVKPGDVIGLVGSSGASTGAHLHVELHLTLRNAVFPGGRQVKVDPEDIDNLQAAIDAGDDTLFNGVAAFMNEFRQKIALREYRPTVTSADLRAAGRYRVKKIEAPASPVDDEED